MGWGVLWGVEPEHPQVLDSGVIETDSKQPLAHRLTEIESDLSALLDEFRPHHVALENLIVDSSFLVDFQERAALIETLLTFGNSMKFSASMLLEFS